jgi:hypothetical protein
MTTGWADSCDHGCGDESCMLDKARHGFILTLPDILVIDSLRLVQKDRPSTPPAQTPRPITSIRKTRPSFLPQEVNAGSSRFGQLSTPSRRTPSGQNRRTPSSSTPGAKSTLQTQNQKQSREQFESAIQDVRICGHRRSLYFHTTAAYRIGHKTKPDSQISKLI